MQTVFVRFPPNKKSCINPCFLLPPFYLLSSSNSSSNSSSSSSSPSPPPPPPLPPPPPPPLLLLLFFSSSSSSSSPRIHSYHLAYFYSLFHIFHFFLAKSLQEPISQLTLDEDEAAGSENEDGEGVAATKELPEYACR